VVSTRFRIGPEDRVATAGSCFAQHISRKLRSVGFNFFVTEAGDGLTPKLAQQRNFGVFSARYGNIYTTAQLRQVFEEAFDARAAHDRAWVRKDGRFVDPFRPQIEPDGFASPQDVSTEREAHLLAVRRMFLECSVFVFTLGLTEAWRSRRDGSVFPLAPGVAGGSFDPQEHEAVNFGVAEVQADLEVFLARLKEVNPQARVVLTVSPVPLIATFEDQHVVCSTTYSKSVLRVVAEQATRKHGWVEYFPSYEIITASNAGGRYYGPDYRDVNHLGVAHAMRCFLANYTSAEGNDPELAAALNHEVAGAGGVVCDEEMIAAARG
jgi:hypothetical protein